MAPQAPQEAEAPDAPPGGAFAQGAREGAPRAPETKAKSAGFPRAAVVAIAVSGLFCALTLGFLTLFAQRIQAGPAIAGVNAFVLMNGFATAFMVLGSLWMLWKLLPQAEG